MFQHLLRRLRIVLGAWWTDTDVSLDEYTRSIELMTEREGIPTTLVVHVGLKYLGSVLLIDKDLDVRPHFSPWIAALWVEPESRSQGCAATLINAAREEAANLGYDTCYQCVTEANSPYYIARGFHLLEPDIQGLNIFTI